MKKARSFLLLILILPLLSGAVLGETALPEPEVAEQQMLLGENEAEYSYEATLYYVGVDGVTLSQVSRTLLIESGETLPEAVLDALFSQAGSPAQVSIAPGDTRVISCRLTGGIVTVDLSIEARNVQSDRELLMMYAAIAGTLSKIDGVHGVNILINGRQEGVLQLPIGVLGESADNLAAAWAQWEAEADRYLGSAAGSITRTAVVYRPSADGLYLVPEARELSFTHRQCAEAMLAALCSPPALSCALATFPAGAEPLAADTVLIVTAAGERILEINLRGEAVRLAEDAGVERWQIYGSLALSLCSFVPELDGVRLSIDGVAAAAAARAGSELSLTDGLLLRRRFSDFVGGVAELYLADADGNLVARERAMSAGEALSPRALLSALLSDAAAAQSDAARPLPANIAFSDILGVYVEDGVAAVNLSARFYGACQGLDERGERTAVYAMVNTLCALDGVRGVRFLVEGKVVDTLAGRIYLRSVLLPSPGLALTD